MRIPISENYPHFLSRVLRHPVKATQAFLPVKKPPSIVWFETTNRCNLRCRSCSKFYQLYDSSTDMSLELFNRVFDQIQAQAECIILTGIGEALYHRDAHAIFERLIQHDHYRVEFTTNGKLMDEDWLQFLSKLRCHVTFSVDGADRETHQFNRPKSNLENIQSALQRAREMELAAPDPAQFPFKRRINFVVMANNMRHMPEMVRWAHEYGAEMLVFILMSDWGLPEHFWAEQNPLNQRQELMELIAECRALAESLQVNLVAPTISPPPPPVTEQVVAPPPSRKKLSFNWLNAFEPSAATRAGLPRFEDRFCDLPFKSLYMRADGKTSFCCASWHVELGDANTQSIAEIWNSMRYRIPRIAMNVGSHTSFCRTCDLPYGLAGGNPWA